MSVIVVLHCGCWKTSEAYKHYRKVCNKHWAEWKQIAEKATREVEKCSRLSS